VTRVGTNGDGRTARALGLLGAAVLSVTALVRVPVELYRVAALDFASASRDLLVAVLLSGLLLFALLASVLILLPARLGRPAALLLAGLAGYSWVRSGFFPGPSVNLDGSPVTVDLTTGWAGLLVPVAAGILLAALGARRAAVAGTLLAVLLGGSVVQSALQAVSVWGTRPPSHADAAEELLDWSRNGNVFVLILDSLQSDVFEDVLEAEPRLREDLDGFRHYRLASSSAPTTYLSLPTIHSGVPYEPGRSVLEFFREAMYERSVLNRLDGAGYRTSYAVGIGQCPRSVTSCTSTAQLARSRFAAVVEETTQLLDLGVYRVLPDSLRGRLLRRGTGPVSSAARRAALAGRLHPEAAALLRLASGAHASDSPPAAKMVHSLITHPPYLLQPDCSAGERRSGREAARFQAQCAFRQVVALLERLQAEGVYDVSSIVILADHGYGLESAYVTASEDPHFRRMVGFFNPTVLVKPAGARGPLVTSDAPIQLADVAHALCSEAGCSPADGLRRLDEVDEERTRTAFWYGWHPEYWNLPEIPGMVRYSIRGDLPCVESWSRSAAAYVPGTVILFRRGGNLGDYAGFGWGYRQKTHTWMVDPDATLGLKAAFEPGRDYSLAVEAEPTDGSPSAPKRVLIRVNGVEVGQVVSVSPTSTFETRRFVVPAAVLSRSPDTVILFSAEAVSGAAGRGRSNARLAVRSVELRPAP
jgi:hypothetical protein